MHRIIGLLLILLPIPSSVWAHPGHPALTPNHSHAWELFMFAAAVCAVVLLAHRQVVRASTARGK